MIRAGRRGHAHQPSASRAALELLAALLVGAAVLVAPFGYAAFRLNAAERVPKARAAQIAHADCRQLRDIEPDGSTLGIMFWGPTAERAAREQHLINERGRALRCRPPIEPQLENSSD